MPEYVGSNTPNSLQYQLMLNPNMVVDLSPGQVISCPDEYQPIALSIDENIDDIFIEPAIKATYFAMVDLQIGGQWLITDPENRGLYLCRVATKRTDKQAGTVTYTFNTLMSRLAKTEPAGLVISSAAAGLGSTATPNEVLNYLVSRWSAEVKGLSLAAPVPPIELRGAEGAIIPYVLFLSVQQQVGQSLSVREWLERFFDIFEGYSYRLNGNVLNVLPPMYQQTESILLSPSAPGTPGALVLEEDVTISDGSVINSQTVSHRPLTLVGEFTKNEDGTPKVPNDLPEIGEPCYYRQGDTQLVAKPTDRRFCRNGVPTPYLYTEDKFPELKAVRVTFTAYVWESITTDAQRNGGTELGDRASGVKTVEASQHFVQQTHVVDLGVGPGARPFDAVFHWVNGPQSAVWVWRLKATPKGVKATLIEPTGNPTLTCQWYPVPWWVYLVPVLGLVLLILRLIPAPASMGAEFHLNVQGQAWERGDITYSGTYGVYTPPTLPPGLEAPPFETATDAAVEATEAIYGHRPGDDKVIDIWSLVPLPTTTAAELSEAQKDANEAALRELVSKTLLNIAQNSVKERLLPYETITLSLMRPFPVTVGNIGKLATYGKRTGLIRSYSLIEQHTMQGSEVLLEVTLRVPQTAERQPITFVPITPEEDGVPFIPPGYPPSGNFEPLPPPPPELPTNPPVTAGPGMVQLDLGRRFDLLRLKATGERRIRLYRTDAARTADAAREATEVVTVETTEYTVNTAPAEEVFEQLILEARLPFGDNDFLDLHSVLGHTPTGVCYANIEGGPVTFYRWVPEGLLDGDSPETA